eukprot:TRINITY_DN942_c0_g1_i4.p2 TRINITY_DN942_c0_g1~~TRINITY_DN942_c0_g1_i4.p2  ORF type:complete len:540 (+),score=235.47 TRINITY_DN942_c0_g1_i4:67-1686(+)
MGCTESKPSRTGGAPEGQAAPRDLPLPAEKAAEEKPGAAMTALKSQNPLPACRHESILTTVGKTPLVKLNRLSPKEGVDLYVKAEAFNPMGSVKDRLALGVIEWAEHHGHLQPGQTVVEASSGNTGIGLAMVCAAKGYPYVCVMAESFSIERRKLMRFLGAKVILTNPAHKASGMLIKCQELAEKHGWFNTHQFSNEANAWVHSQTTGPEITEAMGEVKLTDFFCAWGTGGTLQGVARHLRAASPETKVHCCEPDNAPLLFSGAKTEYQEDGRFKEPHPVWRPHLLQGWATDFIPKLVSDAVDAGYVDHIRHVGGDSAHATSRALAQKEGIFTGTSGGGVLSCAVEFAKTAPEGSAIVCILADTGERYLSTPLFADIPADMTAEEKEIAASTPSAPPPGITLPEVTEGNVKFVNDKNAAHKVVVWSLEYCEFCWTIFGLFKALGVEYEVINVDAFKYAKDNQGNKYRAALCSVTDCKTFPQCFIDGKFFGGAADACMKWKSKELQPILEAAGIEYNKDYAGDAFEFLPKWMSQNPLRSK